MEEKLNNKTCIECCGFSESENRCLLLGGRGKAYADNEACRRFSEKKPIPPITNGDVIRQMSNAELATWGMYDLGTCPTFEKQQSCSKRGECSASEVEDCWREWLNAPAQSQLNDVIQNVIKDGVKKAIDIHEAAYAPDMNVPTKESEGEMNKIKIVRAEAEYLEFSDGTTITPQHDADCCEYNYADFSQIDDLAKEWEFEHPILFEESDYGFRFGNKDKMVFVPCYSSQSGYYSYDVDIFYNDKPVLVGVQCDDK